MSSKSYHHHILSLFSALILCLQISIVRSQNSTNETGLLSDLWNSLTTVGKTPACPGECVHAITSIFCDNVLEEISCGESFLRCCVPQHFSHGTPVETSPPIMESTTESFSVISNNHYGDSTTSQVFTENPVTSGPTTPPIDVTTPHNENTNLSLHYVNNFSLNQSTDESTRDSTLTCPVECSNPPPNTFCVKSIHNTRCDSVQLECCLERETAVDTMTKNFIKLVQQSVALNETKNIGSELNSLTSSTTVAPATCDGTCVVPLFSILCDEIDTNQFCPNGGSCCVNREPTTVVPPITTCPGSCIPVILSGMCTKPYELILKAVDCEAGNICCANKKYDYSDGTDINSNPNEPGDAEGSKPTLLFPDNGPPFINQQGAHIPQMGTPNQYGNYPSGHNPVMQIPPMQPIQPMLTKPIQFVNRNPKPPHKINSGNEGHPIQTHFPSIQNPVMKDPNYHSMGNPTIMVDPHSKIPYRHPSLNENVEHGFNKPVDDLSQNVPADHLGNKNYVNKDNFPCPGTCISPMFKFTCFGANSIYTSFQCHKGQVCCSPVTEIEKYETFVQSTTSQSAVNFNRKPLPPPPPPPPSIQIDTRPDIHEEPSPHVCGVKGLNRNGRIVGGSDSYPGEWCWQIALVNQHNKYVCGAALIGKQWVLTAAHCVTSYVRKNEPLFVRAGEYDLTRSSRLAQMQKVSTAYIHHNHNSQSLDNDIAILKLQSPVELNGNICLVCLPTRNTKRYPGKRCTVTGYGFQQESGPIALRIREASVPIVESQECSTRINSVTEKVFILPASSFCAGGEGGNDACQGDGGSGLVCESDGFYELTGLVSWGFGCGRNGVPGVYVKVSSFVGWINQIVSTNSN